LIRLANPYHCNRGGLFIIGNASAYSILPCLARGLSWSQNWTDLSTYFKYPPEVRKLIYTTNAVEGFHRMLRKYTKTKTTYPSDDAVKKISIFVNRRNLQEMEYTNTRLGNNNGTVKYLL